MRQRFSVTTHPRLQMIVCSYGYLVTFLQLPVQPTCLSIMRGLCVEASAHLQRVASNHDASLTSSSYFKNTRKKKGKGGARMRNGNKRSQFDVSKRSSLKIVSREDVTSPDAAHYSFEPEPTGLPQYDSDYGGMTSPHRTMTSQASGHVHFDSGVLATADFR